MMFENFPALLVTKLYIPRLRASHVSRPYLLSLMDAGLEHKLILISAAAGFGKTTLVADWCSRRAEHAAWYALDEGDNDPARFLSYLVAAIQTCRPDFGHDLFIALQSPQPPVPEFAIRSLINQIAAFPERLILVLDDYHVIENQAIHTVLAFLIDHLLPQLTLILLTRNDPPLPLARLRAKNDLLEIRAALLRFSPEEIEHFLNQTIQFQLSADAIAALEQRTEGWIAGLQLAALAMQALSDDKETFIQHFTGSHRFVLDYLMEEVLARQPENVRRFLLKTSFLTRLTGSLCSAVMDEPDGQAMLAYLEKHNLFLVPLDETRTWYRYHHLFADLLRARLLAESPAELKMLQQRAAHWYARHELPEEAVTYALAAEDFDLAAELITGPAARVMRRGEVMTLLGWYRAFPPEFVAHQPGLALQFGMAFALNGRWNEAETLLNYVEESQRAESRPENILLLAYLVASYRQDEQRLTAIVETATAKTSPDRITKLVLALVISLKGDLTDACQLLAASQQASEQAGDFLLALTALYHQCRFHVFLGNLHRAHELSQQALQRAQQMGGPAVLMASFAHTSLGRIFIEWNELEKAAYHLSQAIHTAESSGFVTGVLSSATMMLAEVKQAQGDTDRANQAAQAAIAHAEQYDPPPEVLWLKTYQARLWLQQGNLTAAADWLHSTWNQSLQTSLFYPVHIQKITQSRILLARRKIPEALSLLTQLTTEPPSLLTVEILLTLALARQAHGDSVHALLALEQALTLAETENRRRVFFEMGASLAKLLTNFVQSHPEYDYARSLLAMLPAQTGAGIDPLGERELAVLRLIVAGHSNEEIAQQLSLAISTVKWYINVIYSKLQVKTRSQAIARVHELKLLDS